MTPADATTPGGFLLVLAILAPSAGILASFLLGGRTAERILLVLSPIGLALAAAIAALVWRSGQPIAYVVAGVAPPLGIALRADGISSVMLVATALLVPAAALFARASFATPPDVLETRKGLTFWIMLQAIWAALTIIFVSGDLFNLYVALELLTFGAVPLVCLDGRPETLAAALRYLMFALFGSILYLLGVALIYGCYGTLDIALLADTRPAAARGLGRSRADDRRAPGEDRALPAAPLAAPGARQRASRGERGPLRPGGQGIVLHHRADLVLCPAGAARAGRRGGSRRRSGRWRSCSAACWRCGRRASSCWSPIRPSPRSAISSSSFRSPRVCIPGRRTDGAAASCRRLRTPSPRRPCSSPPDCSPSRSGTTASPSSPARPARCR